MTLVQVIEHVYSVRAIKVVDNNCYFEFENDIQIQDKGMSKKNSIYNCSFRILCKFWEEDTTLFIQKTPEPFDIEDLL